MATEQRDSLPEFIEAGLYFYDESGYITRGFRAKTGEPGIVRSHFCNCFRSFLCARRSLAIANASPDALVGVSSCRIIPFRWDSKTDLAASLEQILDEAWLAYGTHRQSDDYGGVVLHGSHSHCAPVSDTRKRSVALITRSRSAELLDRTTAARTGAWNDDESILGEYDDVVSERLLGVSKHSQEILAAADPIDDAGPWGATGVRARKCDRSIYLHALLTTARGCEF